MHYDAHGVRVPRWTEWVVGGMDAEIETRSWQEEEKRVMALWPTAFSRVRGLVASYMRTNPDSLLRVPKNEKAAEASKAWASPRSWELAMRVIAGGKVHDTPDALVQTLVQGCIGKGPTQQLIEYMANIDLPDPEDILTGRVQWAHDKSRLDRTVAVVNSLAAYVTDKNMTSDQKLREKYATKVWVILGEIKKACPSDVIIPAAKSLVKARLMMMTEADQTMIELQPVLEAAGMTPNSKASKRR
jgi:hypothetical protein